MIIILWLDIILINVKMILFLKMFGLLIIIYKLNLESNVKEIFIELL